MVDLPPQNNLPQVSNPSSKRKPIMGDRSPKSVHKQAAQKQSKASEAAKQKQQAVAAKQLGGKNR